MTKSILITGCSTGIGYESAKMLKEHGWRVFASARKPEDVSRLASEGFEAIQLDVTDQESIKNALQTVLDKTDGKLDALFNNAGYMQAGALEDLSPELIQAQFNTNTFGPITLTQAVIPIMRQQGHGRIIFNSSILGVIAMPFYGAYNGSKFALDGMVSTLRQEFFGTDIHVSLICPGPIKSALRNTARQQYEKSIKGKKSFFSSYYEKMEKSYFKREEVGAEDKSKLFDGPDVVAKQLIHALESKRPKARYYSGLPAKFMAMLRRLLPDCLLDRFILKVR